MIADLRGVPIDTSRSRRRETRAVGDLADQLLKKYRVGLPSPEDVIRDAWPEIVGAPNAEFCHPLRIDRGRTLIVGVSNPIIRQELLFHKALVRQRIQALPGCAHLRNVVFRAG